jgi:hypothetical protein
MNTTITTLLAQIAKRNTNAIGVLADYMEENNLPHAKRVRGWWKWYADRVQWWTDGKTDHSRRVLTVWENMEIDREYVRIQVGKVFGKKWKVSDKWRRYVRA